jgi:hypothetical protein
MIAGGPVANLMAGLLALGVVGPNGSEDHAEMTGIWPLFGAFSF